MRWFLRPPRPNHWWRCLAWIGRASGQGRRTRKWSCIGALWALGSSFGGNCNGRGPELKKYASSHGSRLTTSPHRSYEPSWSTSHWGWNLSCRSFWQWRWSLSAPSLQDTSSPGTSGCLWWKRWLLRWRPPKARNRKRRRSPANRQSTNTKERSSALPTHRKAEWPLRTSLDSLQTWFLQWSRNKHWKHSVYHKS